MSYSICLSCREMVPLYEKFCDRCLKKYNLIQDEFYWQGNTSWPHSEDDRLKLIEESKHAPGCSNELSSYEAMPCQSEPMIKQIGRAFVNPGTPSLKDSINSKVAFKEAVSERERINIIIRGLVDRGEFILNERPKDMTIEDYRFIRKELDFFRKKHLQGTVIHESRSGKRLTKGQTYFNPDKK